MNWFKKKVVKGITSKGSLPQILQAPPQAVAKFRQEISGCKDSRRQSLCVDSKIKW